VNAAEAVQRISDMTGISRSEQQVRVFMKASAGRNRINVLGAVNAITKEVVTLTNLYNL
jgi:hypothetical protein